MNLFFEDYSPSWDAEETDSHYLLSMDVPGVSKDQLNVEFQGSHLLISGERQRFGKFRKAFTLPKGVDASKVEANCTDGVLRVYLPKAESVKPRQIKVTGPEPQPEKAA
jgi:HSP20 family protein